MTYEHYLEIAIKAANESGKILKNHFGKNEKIEFKKDYSPVTITDTESEKKITEILTKEFPDHAILAEESGSNAKQSDFLWVIDPLDGTSNYSNDIPFFCISIGLLYKNSPIVATIFDPIHNEIFTAYKNGGSYMNDSKINLNPLKDYKTKYISLVYSRSVENKEPINNIFKNLNPPEYRIRNMGASALELAYVSCGKLQGIFINGNNPWDVCAGILLILEAGGKVTDFNNKPWTFASSSIIAGPETVHKQLVSAI